MDSKDNHTTEPSIEREVLLEYLLDQCDSTHRHHLRLGFLFQFLGYAALYHDKERLQVPACIPIDWLARSPI